jgi:hypothetical protein
MGDNLVTIPNVQLIAVGAWKAMGSSPGKSDEVVFTENDLKAIMASQDAPDVKEPRMILGHTGPTVGPGLGVDGFYGEQPCIGKFTNLSLTADGQEIMADLVGVPKWLGDILPTAYPNRSVEVYWDIPSGIAGAKNHECLMPRVALCGLNLPAVATLDDLKVLFSEEGPEMEIDLSKANKRVAASRGDLVSHRAAASVQFEDVRREFYSNFATEASGRYWWWINAVYVDPPLLIVDDDEEGLWSVPYSVKGDSVEFGDPVSIKVQYVEEESGKVAASQVTATGRQYAKAASRPSDRTTKKEAVKMGLDITALRERTGLTVEQLPDDASEEQINAALSAPPAPKDDPAAPEGAAGEAPAAGDGGEGAGADGAGGGEGAAASASAAGGTVTVDRAAWDQQQATIKRLESDLDTRVAASRDTVVAQAIKDGKIPPSRREHYVKLMGTDPEGTTELLAGLEPGVIPTSQREMGLADTPGSEGAEASAAYDPSWLSDSERARVEAARAGSQTSRLVMEG